MFVYNDIIITRGGVIVPMALKKVGGLWKQTGKQDKEYLAGSLDLGAAGEARIMVFANEKKSGNQPDYSINLVIADKDEAK